jgi:hypothetical protein
VLIDLDDLQSIHKIGPVLTKLYILFVYFFVCVNFGKHCKKFYFFATASIVKYSILDGNTYDAFFIEDLTGKIRVNSKLDYENITSVSNSVIGEKYCYIHPNDLKSK